ncbi:MAG TPA: hypothetical protein VHB02_02760 [Acidimicrobiales bacterium]|nr:hypothetical protein [Acidimicrobiales bacterium]
MAGEASILAGSLPAGATSKESVSLVDAGCSAFGGDAITVTFTGFPAGTFGYSYRWSYGQTIAGTSVWGTPRGTGQDGITVPSAGTTVSGPVGNFGPGSLRVKLTWFKVGGGEIGTTIGTFAIPACTPPTPYFTAIASTATETGYVAVTSRGVVTAKGPLLYAGDPNRDRLNDPIVGVAPTADNHGYWMVASDGGVFAFGDAQFYGSMGGQPLNKPIVGMAPTPDGQGYWLVASDGGLFAFGDAQFYGSMGGQPLNKPIVGMASDRATGGYWLVASDGGVFAFNAPFYGSTGDLVLQKPITAIEAAPDGSGYRFVAADGGVFSFNLPFAGSLGASPPANPVDGIAPYGNGGYWIMTNAGHVYPFGGAPTL